MTFSKVAIVAILWCSYAQAEVAIAGKGTYARFRSGADLVALCGAPAGSADRTTCLGYVEGATDALLVMQAPHGVPTMWCLPNTVTSSLVASMVVERLKQHPERQKYGAMFEVGSAVAETYPCK